MQAARTEPAAYAPVTPVLRASGLRFAWPGAATPVLEAVGLGVWPGQVMSVIGENGAGKTTLLRVLAGLLDGGGTVAIQGLRFAEDRVGYQRRLGLLTAGNSGLYGRLKVRQHLDLWLRAAYVPLPLRAERTAAAIDDFRLGDLLDSRADRISMGQRQRLRLALTFLHRPDLVLLDEPATSLDDRGRRILDRAVIAHRSRGGAVVWCSPGTPGSAPEHAPAMRLHHGRLLPA